MTSTFTSAALEKLALDEIRAKLTREALHDLADELHKEYPALSVNTTYPQIRDGLTLSVALWPEGYLYVYIIPWARGWSVFVDSRSKHEIPTWNTVDDKYKGLQRPIYCQRGHVGPWTVPTIMITTAVNQLVSAIQAMSAAKRAVYMRQSWPRALYWYFTKFMDDQPTYRHDQPWENRA